MEDLKRFVRNAENRYLWYKKELDDMYIQGFGKTDPEWMAHLKEMKKIEEHTVKVYREELTFLNQGLNPPFFYEKTARKPAE